MTAPESDTQSAQGNLSPRASGEELGTMELPQLIHHTEQWIDARVAGAQLYSQRNDIEARVGIERFYGDKYATSVAEAEVLYPAEGNRGPYDHIHCRRAVLDHPDAEASHVDTRPTYEVSSYVIEDTNGREHGRAETIRWRQGDPSAIVWPNSNLLSRRATEKDLQYYGLAMQDGIPFDRNTQLVVGDKIVSKASALGIGMRVLQAVIDFVT